MAWHNLRLLSKKDAEESLITFFRVLDQWVVPQRSNQNLLAVAMFYENARVLPERKVRKPCLVRGLHLVGIGDDDGHRLRPLAFEPVEIVDEERAVQGARQHVMGAENSR